MNRRRRNQEERGEGGLESAGNSGRYFCKLFVHEILMRYVGITCIMVIFGYAVQMVSILCVTNFVIIWWLIRFSQMKSTKVHRLGIRNVHVYVDASNFSHAYKQFMAGPCHPPTDPVSRSNTG